MSEPLSVPVLARMLAASEWDERQRALRTLAHAGAQLTPELITPLLVRPALAAASAHGPSQSLCPSASRLPLAPAPLLVQQLSDARSQIVREATACVAALATALGASFGPLSETLLPPLLALTFVTIQIMSESGDQCIKHVLRHAGAQVTPGAVQLLVTTAMTSKHAVLRRRCVEYVGQLLAEQRTAMLERFRGDVETLILSALGDAAAPVRQGARLLWWAHKAHWPARASELLTKVDARTAALILKDEGRSWDEYIAEGQPRVSAIKDFADFSAPSQVISTPSYAQKKRTGLKERTNAPSEILPSPLDREKALRRHFSTTPKSVRVKSISHIPIRSTITPLPISSKPTTNVVEVVPSTPASPPLSVEERLSLARADSASSLVACALALLPETAALDALTGLVVAAQLDSSELASVVPAAASLCTTSPLPVPVARLFSALTVAYSLAQLLPSPDPGASSRNRLTMLRYLNALVVCARTFTEEQLVAIFQCVADSNPWYKSTQEREEGLAVFVAGYKLHNVHYKAALQRVVFDSHPGKNMQMQRLIFRLLKNLTASVLQEQKESHHATNEIEQSECTILERSTKFAAFTESNEAPLTPAATRNPPIIPNSMSTGKRIKKTEREAAYSTSIVKKAEKSAVMRTPLSPKSIKSPKAERQKARFGKENANGQVRSNERPKTSTVAREGVEPSSWKGGVATASDDTLSPLQRDAVAIVETGATPTQAELECVVDVALRWCSSSDRSTVSKGETLLHVACLRSSQSVTGKALTRACATPALTEALAAGGFDLAHALHLVYTHLESDPSRSGLVALSHLLAVADDGTLVTLASAPAIADTFAKVLSHSDAMVRRDATVLLATLWRRLGAQFDSQLAALQPRERKLVALYRDKQLRSLAQ